MIETKMRTVLITGASRGIGRATALLFGEQGWNVGVCCNTNREAAEETAACINQSYPHAEVFQADLTQSGSACSIVSRAVSRFGGIDALVNNAGTASYGLFQDMPEADMELVLGTNLIAPLHMTKAVLRQMLPRQTGSIVNVSSVWGICGASCEAVYAASKGALIAFTKSLAAELGPSGIRVNCVAPGAVETDMLAGFTSEEKDDLAERTPLERIGRPEEIADAIFYLAGPRSSYITGAVLNVSGGLLL